MVTFAAGFFIGFVAAMFLQFVIAVIIMIGDENGKE